jgi:hypothetical protein
MPIELKGKLYKLVSERLEVFFEKYPDHKIVTHVTVADPGRTIMEANIVHDQRVVASGHAEGVYGADSFTSKVLEKAETCSVGRALAFLDKDLMGAEIASADEISAAIQQKSSEDAVEYMALVRKHFDFISQIKEAIANNEPTSALCFWRDIHEESEDDYKALWRAPSKGGIFTTAERKALTKASEDDYKQRTM